MPVLPTSGPDGPVRDQNRGMPKARVRAAAYWKRGAPATHEVIDD